MEQEVQEYSLLRLERIERQLEVLDGDLQHLMEHLLERNSL